MRLIDADKVSKTIDRFIGYLDEDMILRIKMKISKIPTVERPHGEWKYESYGQYLSTYKCSNCGFHGDKQWICCPYCGTDMRKRGETE